MTETLKHLDRTLSWHKTYLLLSGGGALDSILGADGFFSLFIYKVKTRKENIYKKHHAKLMQKGIPTVEARPSCSLMNSNCKGMKIKRTIWQYLWMKKRPAISYFQMTCSVCGGWQIHSFGEGQRLMDD